MAIYDIWLSRNNSSAVDNYVGHAGRLFYDPAERVLRISDGSTAGGEVFNGLVTVTNLEPTDNFQGQIWLNPEDSVLSVYHNGNFIPTIDVATETKLGGIKLGPGVTVNAQGQIIIDSEGLDFSFGDIASTTEIYPVGHPDAGDSYAVLSTINTDEDLYLVSNGVGSIDVIGEFKVYKTDGDVAGAISIPPIFTVKGDGQIRMLVPGADSSEGALNIIGGLDGVFQAPVNAGVMLHVTGIAGSPGIPSRVYNDAQNAFAAFVARRYNNTAANPSAVLANEEIMRLSGTTHNGTEIPGTANQRIVYVARGNQTTSNQGGAIELWATPLNSITLAKVATVDSTGIILESGKVLTGNVTGNVSGTAGSVEAANITGTTLASGITTSSLTSVGTLTSGSIGAGFTAIDNARLAHSTISGIALGNNLATLTIGTHLTGTSYNGSTGITIATDATTNATASVLVARDSNGMVTAQNYKGNSRAAGTLGAGSTLTINYYTDHIVFANITGAITIAHQNITAGCTVKVVLTNATGGNLAVTSGVSNLNTTGNNATANLNANRMGVYEFISFGTTTTTLYCSVNK
jgi:hypothetical protein